MRTSLMVWFFSGARIALSVPWVKRKFVRRLEAGSASVNSELRVKEGHGMLVK